MASVSSERQTWRERWWWLVLAVIVVLAGALRYTGHDFSLPYVDHPDEPNQVIAGQKRVEEGSAIDIGYHAYSPGHPTLSYLLVRWFHDSATPPTTMIGPLRLIAITVSLLLIVAIGLLAREVASPLAGLLAAFLWAVSPTAVTFSRFAMPDIYLAFFTVLAVYLTLIGTRYDRDDWATAGVVASMAAVAFKYQGVFIVPVIGLAPLWRLRQPGIDRRRVWRNIAWNALYYAAFFFWLLAIYPALEANTIPYYTGATSKLHLPRAAEISENLWLSLSPLRDGWAWLPALGGLLWFLWKPARRQVDGFSLVLVAASGILWWLLISFFGVTALRQMLGLAALLVVLAGIGLSLWIASLTEFVAWAGWPLPAWSASAVVGGLVAIASIPALVGAIENAHEHSLPDRRNDLAVWADQTLAGGRYLGTTQFHKVFNRSWGGYTGETYFEYAEQGTLDTYPLDDLSARDIEYAIVLPLDAEIIGQTAEGQAILDTMTRLKLYPASADFRDPGIVVYWLHPIEHNLNGQLGPLQLVGINLSATEVVPGDTITFRLFWRADSPTDVPYRVYNHLTALDDRQPLAQVDGPPLPSERRTTADWSDPAETLMSRDFVLTLPSDLAPGEYRLLTGFYNSDTGLRLTGPDGSDSLLLTHIYVGSQ